MWVSIKRCFVSIGVLMMVLLGAGFAHGAERPEPFPADWFFGEPEQRREQDAMIGRRAPALNLTNWMNGGVTAKSIKNKIVIVDFWATWCGPCISAIPHNNEMAAKYADQGVVLIGACGSNRGQERMAEIVEQHGIQYPVGRDRSRRAAKAWKVMWWPTYAVVDRNGMVRAVGLKPSYVDDVVDALLQEQPLEEAEGSRTARKAGAQEPVADDNYEPVPARLLEGNAEQRERLAGLDPLRPPTLTVQNWIGPDANRLEALGDEVLKELRGKVVVVDFWATWCGPCIASIPHTNAMVEKYGPDGLVVLGVCHTRGADKMERAVKKHDIRYHVAADIGQRTNNAFEVNGLPDYYVFDRHGRLRAADVRSDSVEEVVQMLLAEPGPDDEAVASAE